MMGRAAKREHLNHVLNSHAQSIHDTFQMFERPADCTLEKAEWSRVTKMGDDVSKQATITGMLWSGGTPDVRQLEENIAVYCNILQGFLLLCHGSTVGVGPTLLLSIRASAKQVIDRSISLLRDPILSYGSQIADKNVSVAHLSGSVWEACAALKKSPSSNSVAIGRAMTRVAVSMKDVLREMKELKLTMPESDVSNKPSDEDDEFGSDLSHEEMNNAQLVISVVSDALSVIKELIRFITVMLKGPKPEANIENHVDSLEGLLKHCQEIGSQIDELGACVYPPQEPSLMKKTAVKLIEELEGMRPIVFDSIGGSAKDFVIASEGLKSSLTKLRSEMVSVDDECLVNEMGKLGL